MKDEDSDSFSSSDSDMTDSSKNSENENQKDEGSEEDQDEEEENNDNDEDEDDELVKAIKAAKEKNRKHPPDLNFEDLIVDISFHPGTNIIATGSVVGDVSL